MCIILHDEAIIPQDHPSGSAPFKLVDELERVPLDISEDEDVDHLLTPLQVLLIVSLLKDLRAKKNLALFLKSHPLLHF